MICTEDNCKESIAFQCALCKRDFCGNHLGSHVPCEVITKEGDSKECPNPNCEIPLDKHTHTQRNICHLQLNTDE